MTRRHITRHRLRFCHYAHEAGEHLRSGRFAEALKYHRAAAAHLWLLRFAVENAR